MNRLIALRQAVLAGVALVALATPSFAQEADGERPGRPERAERRERPQAPQGIEQRQARPVGGSEGGWRGRSDMREGQWRERARIRDADEHFARPELRQQQPQQQVAAPAAPPPPRSYGGNRSSSYGAGQRDGSYGAYRGRGWQRPQPQVEQQPPVASAPPAVLRQRDRNWRDDRRDDARRDDRRDERRDDWRNYNRGYRDGYRADNRHYSPGHHRWDRNHWRNDRRYDWYRYRAANRSIFSPGRYYAPYRNYSYSRISIGFRLGRLFYSNRYWINDPWRYRLPDVYGPYRWVRYYDDAILVDIYSGEVVDVIHDFFW